MKFTLALLSTAIAAVSAATEISEIKADTKLGQGILSKARKLEGNDEQDTTWIANMSLKFQGCHHISQWNPEADGQDDVRIESKRLAKFRLCPSNTCNSGSARGCSKGYGDYIVDLDDFLATYLQNKEGECENYKENSCNCGNADDADYCAQTCFKKAGMSHCYQAGDGFELNNYLECAQYGDYYVGTYCASQGGSVLLGMFTDDACTNFADNNGGKSTYYSVAGSALPFSDESIVDTSCYSCKDTSNGNNYGYYETKEVCSNVYEVSGKCESALSSTVSSINTNACSYISGIKTSGSSGVINSGARRGNKVANGFIGVFAVGFVLLGSYTYYLKTKLDRAKINLSD